MELTEARVFEMVGRLHAENRALHAENDRLTTIITQHRCPEPQAPAVEPPAVEEPSAEPPKAPKARRGKAR